MRQAGMVLVVGLLLAGAIASSGCGSPRLTTTTREPASALKTSRQSYLETEAKLPGGGTLRTYRLPNGVMLKVTVPGAFASDSVGATKGETSGYFTWGNGEEDKDKLHVIISKENHLRIQKKDYGAVKSGDSVAVDMTQGGKVLVNDHERRPGASARLSTANAKE